MNIISSNPRGFQVRDLRLSLFLEASLSRGLNARVYGENGAPPGASGDSEDPVSREENGYHSECWGFPGEFLTTEPVGRGDL